MQQTRIAALDGWRGLAILLVLAASFANAFVLSPSYSDLHPVLAGCSAILHHASPYSDEVASATRAEFSSASREYPEDQQRFAYPLPAGLLFAPLALLRFRTAAVFFSAISVLATGASVYWWTGTFRLRDAALACSAYPVMLGISIQQPTMLYAALVSAAFFCMSRERAWIAGVLLSVAAEKPQLLLAVILPVALWAARDWRSRRPVALAFAAGAALQLFAAFYLQPHWFGEWLRTLRLYSSYATPPIVIFRGMPSLSYAVAGLVAALGMLACWRARLDMLRCVSVSIATALLLLPFQAYNEVLLIPAMALLLRARSSALPTVIARLAFYEILAASVLAIAVELAYPPTGALAQAILGGMAKILPLAVYIALIADGPTTRSTTASRSTATAELHTAW